MLTGHLQWVRLESEICSGGQRVQDLPSKLIEVSSHGTQLTADCAWFGWDPGTQTSHEVPSAEYLPNPHCSQRVPPEAG